jgi:thimet oligopeptidase
MRPFDHPAYALLEQGCDPTTYSTAAREALARVRAARDAFRVPVAGASASAILRGWDRLFEPLGTPGALAHLWGKVHPAAEMRAVCDEIEREIAALSTDVSLDRALYERLAALDPAALADDDERRVLARALRDFRRSGVDRDEAQRARIRALNEELVRLGQDFERNIIELGKPFRIADGAAGLVGLSEDFKRSHPCDPDGSITLSTDPQDRIPFMSYAERGDLRREYMRASLTRAFPENLGVLRQLLALRAELAGLLGYSSWADYVTEDKMARSAAEVRAFLERVIAVARPLALDEVAELLAEKRLFEPEAAYVGEWDRLFLVERQKRTRHAFDSQGVRDYFAYDAVRDGVLAVTGELYGLTFRARLDLPRWHPSVEIYDVDEAGKPIARLYLDMHPRAGKYKHAAMFDLVAGLADGPLPSACLVCNFPAPSASDPGLMLHDQVTTFFHEFGHLMHHLLAGRQRWRALSGISTEWDFVEVPSQLYEEWAWDPAVLARFARHWQTGAPIPPELVERMRRADECGQAIHVLVQMFYARVALDYHLCAPDQRDLGDRLVDLKREMLPFPHLEGTHFEASFGHLHGYSAMYYTYMWSLVIAKDVLSRFGVDLMDSATAATWRERVLAPGGSRDAADLVRSFLGREVRFEALESWLRKAVVGVPTSTTLSR